MYLMINPETNETVFGDFEFARNHPEFHIQTVSNIYLHRSNELNVITILDKEGKRRIGDSTPITMHHAAFENGKINIEETVLNASDALDNKNIIFKTQKPALFGFTNKDVQSKEIFVATKLDRKHVVGDKRYEIRDEKDVIACDSFIVLSFVDTDGGDLVLAHKDTIKGVNTIPLGVVSGVEDVLSDILIDLNKQYPDLIGIPNYLDKK